MDHHHPHDLKVRNLLYSIFLNVGITLAQVIGGFISGSLALLSDALHNFSDVLSLVFSYVAHKLSKKKASVNQTFGFKRANILAAFINASTLIIVAVFLIYEAIIRFISPQVISSSLVIWLSLLGVLFNGLSVILLKQDSEKNLNMKSAYLHLLTDMLASFAVFIGGLLMKFFQWYWVDSLLTLCIAIYLLFVGYDLLKNATNILMLFTPKHIKIQEIIDEVHKIPGVKKLHHIHVWYLNEEELHLEAHLDCLEDIKTSQFNDLLVQIEKILLEKFQINHTNIQPEYKKIEDSKDFIVQD